MHIRTYLFKSERLGFRNWIESDISKMAAINADPKVMAFFPKIQNEKATQGFIYKMQKQFLEKGFCYFAVDKLEDETFVGFIGVSEQNFEAEFTPCLDIGWRLAQTEWNKGYATEGAKRCLEFAFQELQLENIKAICPIVNKPSENVMIKVGMSKEMTFKHPFLKDYKELECCFLYELENKQYPK